MPLDPSIITSRQRRPDLWGSVQNYYKLGDMIAQRDLSREQLQQARMGAQRQEQIRNAYAQNVNPDGTLNNEQLQGQLYKIDPASGDAFRQTTLKYQNEIVESLMKKREADLAGRLVVAQIANDGTPEGYEIAKRYAQKYEIKDFPDQYDPNSVASWVNGSKDMKLQFDEKKQAWEQQKYAEEAPMRQAQLDAQTNQANAAILNARTSSGRLGLDRQKFEYEKTQPNPQDIKIQDQAKAIENAKIERQNLLSSIDEIIKNPSFDESGNLTKKTKLGGSVGLNPVRAIEWVPGNDQYAFGQKVQNIVNRISLNERQKLRGSGQISDNEQKMLARAATILSTNLDKKTFIEELNKIRNIVQKLEDTDTKVYGNGNNSEPQEFDYDPATGQLTPRAK